MLTVVPEEVLEHFNKTSKKIQAKGYLLLSSLSFVKELWQNSTDMIAHFLSYCDASKSIVTKKFSDAISSSSFLRESKKKLG